MGMKLEVEGKNLVQVIGDMRITITMEAQLARKRQLEYSIIHSTRALKRVEDLITRLTNLRNT